MEKGEKDVCNPIISRELILNSINCWQRSLVEDIVKAPLCTLAAAKVDNLKFVTLLIIYAVARPLTDYFLLFFLLY